jgi:molybdate transport system substrate-binding protein
VGTSRPHPYYTVLEAGGFFAQDAVKSVQPKMGIAKTAKWCALVICMWSGGLRVSADELVVFAAASLTESLREIAADYEKQAGDKIAFNFGASSTLARQIEEGAPADIFFSADEAQMNRLEGKGLIVAGTKRNLLANSLVIIVAARNGASVRSPQDLARADIKRITLGDPKLVPAGVYAKKYLEKAGLWETIAPKVVPTENVRGALAAVEAGNAEAGIVYKTDAMISRKVVVAFAVPLDEGPEIHYPVALVRDGKEPTASRKFLQYLASTQAAKVFASNGFVVLSESAKP